MKYLIICTWFPPDSTIAAVRPYMIAKHLSEKGHEVTVVRSGLFDRKPDDSYGNYSETFDVVSYYGYNSDVRKYEEGEYFKVKANTDGRKFLKKIKRRVMPLYNFIHSFITTTKAIKTKNERISLLYNALNTLSSEGKEYDIVFSTYGELENIYAGKYAASLFDAKLIIDFRDTIVNYETPSSVVWNIYASRQQLRAFKWADLVIAISDHMTNTFKTIYPKIKAETVYNGFEYDEKKISNCKTYKELTLCYTGNFYELRKDALISLLKSIKKMEQENEIDLSDFRFVYAGENSNIVRDLFKEFEVDSILDDRGYVSREDARSIQETSDIFLVLSWNTKKSQGILTGKFYEGIKVGKTILAVVAGDTPKSELFSINEKFHYGYCFETCESESYKGFKKYILGLISEKKKNGRISYTPTEEIIQQFNYGSITEKIIKLSNSIK